MGYVSCHCTDPRTACRDCVCPARLAGRLFEGLKATSSDPLIVYQSSLCLYMHTPPRADSIDAGLVLPGIRSGCPYGPRYHRLRASARWHRMKWPPLDVGAYPTTAMCRPGHDMSGHRSTVRRNGSTIDGDSVHGQSPPPGGGGAHQPRLPRTAYRGAVVKRFGAAGFLGRTARRSRGSGGASVGTKTECAFGDCGLIAVRFAISLRRCSSQER